MQCKIGDDEVGCQANSILLTASCARTLSWIYFYRVTPVTLNYIFSLCFNFPFRFAVRSFSTFYKIRISSTRKFPRAKQVMCIDAFWQPQFSFGNVPDLSLISLDSMEKSCNTSLATAKNHRSSIIIIVSTHGKCMSKKVVEFRIRFIFSSRSCPLVLNRNFRKYSYEKLNSLLAVDILMYVYCVSCMRYA